MVTVGRQMQTKSALNYVHKQTSNIIKLATTREYRHSERALRHFHTEKCEYEKWLTSLASGWSVRKHYLRHEQDLFIYLLLAYLTYSFFNCCWFLDRCTIYAARDLLLVVVISVFVCFLYFLTAYCQIR